MGVGMLISNPADDCLALPHRQVAVIAPSIHRGSPPLANEATKNPQIHDIRNTVFAATAGDGFIETGKERGLEREFARYYALFVQGASDEGAFDTDASDRTEFWRTLIWMLVIVAGLETLLAWRFGHHKSRELHDESKQVFVR